MKLRRRWKIGLLITAYVAVVLVMSWLSLPRALEGAREFQNYQEAQTQRMIKSGQERAERDPGKAPEAPR